MINFKKHFFKSRFEFSINVTIVRNKIFCYFAINVYRFYNLIII
nr:MAG TPA: hypothetical protein [Caudoviricetes sp.]